jgi:hypothetical protein
MLLRSFPPLNLYGETGKDDEVCFCLLATFCTVIGNRNTVEYRLSDIPFYLTCCVGTVHFINSHSEGLNSIETALAYVEQQREATATDALLFMRWRDLAAKKRKEAQKQKAITNLKKKLTFIFKFALC